MSPSSDTTSLLMALRINQLSPEATNWLCTVLTALDAKDVTTYTSFMSESVRVSFNNDSPTFKGRDAVREGLSQYWQGFGTLRHTELNIYGNDRNFVHEALNHYTTLDGREVTLRAVAWIDRNDAGEIVEVRVYSDQSPLWL